MTPETPYGLAITATARRQLAEQLPKAIAFAAHEFTTGPLLANPAPRRQALMPPLDDRHSARRGTYRILYRIDDTTSRCRGPYLGRRSGRRGFRGDDLRVRGVRSSLAVCPGDAPTG